MKLIISLTSIAFLTLSCTKQESTPSGDAALSTESTAAKPYPLDVCLVSGEKLGSMGEPVVIVHEGQEIKFCCDSCLPRFKENPEKYLSQLETQPAE
jgi:YHS domain-containing protein